MEVSPTNMETIVFGSLDIIYSFILIANNQITAPQMPCLQVLLTMIKRRSDSIHIVFEEITHLGNDVHIPK